MTDAELQQLKRRLRRERVEAARQRHPIDKFYAGAHLFDVARERMAYGVVMRMPGADEATIQAEVTRLIELQRKRNESR